jgi:hypothetical protein
MRHGRTATARVRCRFDPVRRLFHAHFFFGLETHTV